MYSTHPTLSCDTLVFCSTVSMKSPMIFLFIQIFILCLRNIQNEGYLTEVGITATISVTSVTCTVYYLLNTMFIILQIDLTNLFSNIEEIYAVNVSFWLSTLKPVMNMVGLNCLIFELLNNRCSPSNLFILLKMIIFVFCNVSSRFKNTKKSFETQAGYFCMFFVLQARHTKKLLNPFYMADGFSTVSNYFF